MKLFSASMFLDFWFPTWCQLRKVNSKIEVFFAIFGQLGPTWANLGEKGVPRRPKTSQESQNGSNKRPKRAKMKPKGAPREPWWPPKYPKMFTQPSRRPHTTFLSPASMKPNVVRANRGGFQGSSQEAAKSAQKTAQIVPNPSQIAPLIHFWRCFWIFLSNPNLHAFFLDFFDDFLQISKSSNP